MKRIASTLFATLFLASNIVLAQTKGIETTQNAQSSPSVNEGANKSASGNGMAQMTSIITGGLMFTQSAMHFGRCPEEPSGCAMGAMFAALGALSMMQAGANGSAKGSALNTAALSDGYGNSNPFETGSYDPEISNSAPFKSTQSAMNSLANKGLYDPKTNTIKSPDGKTYKVDDLSSSEKMAMAGMPQAGISAVMDYANYAAKKAEGEAGKIKLGAMTESNGYAEGGGGGGAYGGSLSSEDDSQYGSTAGLGGSGLGALNRDPAQVAGMQKNYNGEPIGVAADSIFLMMNRRYKVKESQDSFYTELDIKTK